VPKRIAEEDIAEILAAVARHPGGARRADIAKSLPQELAQRTLQFRLRSLVQAGRLVPKVKAGRRSTFCRRRRPHLEPPLQSRRNRQRWCRFRRLVPRFSTSSVSRSRRESP